MILIIWSELKNWYLKSSTRTLAVYLCGLAIPGFLTFLRPVVIFEALALLALWFGLICGKETWSMGRLQEFIYNTAVKPLTVIMGKTLSSFLLTFIHIIFVFPLLLVAVFLWGVSWDVFLGIILLALIISNLATALGFMAGNFLTNVEDSIFGGFILGAYLVITAVFEGLKPINPLVGIFRVITRGDNSNLGFTLFINFLLLLVILIIVWFPYRARKRDKKQ